MLQKKPIELWYVNVDNMVISKLVETKTKSTYKIGYLDEAIRPLVKLDLLADIDMLLIVEKSIRGGIFHSIYEYAKANNKYIEVYCKNKESLYLTY